jgi:hypothetical protein
VELVRGGGGRLQVDAEAVGEKGGLTNLKQQQKQQQQQQQQQQQKQPRPVFMSSRDVVPKVRSDLKAGGSARDVRGVAAEQVEEVWQQQRQQHGIHILRGSIAADVENAPRTRSKVSVNEH